MRFRDLLKEMAASGGSGTPTGDGGSPPVSPPSTPVPTLDSVARIGDAPPGGGQGLSGQGTLKSNGVFIGNQTPEQKHDYTAKSVIGKGIEWTKPTTSGEPGKVYKEDEIETHSEHHGDHHVGDAVTEDVDASSTASSDIATVAYPLFVGGKSKRQKRRNARAAVGQGYNAGPVGVGTGVYESEETNAQDVVKMDVPFLIRALEYAREDAKDDMDIHRRIERMIDKTRAGQVLDMEDYESVFGNTAFTQDISGLGEAHALDHQNVIYRLDKDKPMSNTEVLVIGGAGRYSLEGLRMKARREARALAQDLEIEHGGAFRRSAENIKQLVNTLNTIVAAYNELKRIRQKGGRGSRGITDEDANFIRECYGVAQRWTQRFNLVENNKTGN
jgi:hypothetical protein